MYLKIVKCVYKNDPYLYNFFNVCIKNSFFQHQQCNWADSCIQYPGQLVILRPAGLQTFLEGMHQA